ncbi:hypothetical protein [Microbacterium aerolatum]|uniref:Uncharacterized protein n=1 Tax=Microbacterium aerolatum TaxID=153731 RepID=A0A511AEP0_9MICO|nr:hypothetical protein [Microbacterium aerolatum]GEK86628.1 hypothetical protein MAE01_18040 [Microbacterium aerolatum]GGB18448.1 hypothetical protein GCM10007198_06230 [Microbacterium aerolatum]
MRAQSIVVYTLVCLVVLLAFAIVAGGIALSLFFQKDAPGDQLRYPITWGHAEDPGAPDGSFIELAEDGSAHVVDVTVGEIRIVDVDRVERPCVSTKSGSFTGAATWEIDENGALRVHSEDGSAVLTPWAARFTGDSDWSSVRELFCDAEYADYGARPERR